MADKKIWPQARNPRRHVDGSILSEVQYQEGGQWYPHSSAPDAEDLRNVALYERIHAGEFGPVASFTKREQKEHFTNVNRMEQQALFDDAVAVVRSLADLEVMRLLTDEDKAKMDAWRAYGKAVREVDITVETPVWPDQPSSLYERSV